ncbi:MAG: hypothetical protein Q9166_008003, partial [cf. Caloplaca sp. 2 TL-2023]
PEDTMYIYISISISTLLSLSFLPLSLSLPASPASPLLSLDINESTPLTTTNTAPPLRFYQSQGPNALPNFALIDIYGPPSIPPAWFRPTQRGASIQVLSSKMRESVAHLPVEAPVGKDYLTFGPEYRPNLNYLDTRIVVRQYHERDWGGDGVKEARMRNKELVAAAGIAGNMYGTGEVKTEGAWRMCYMDEQRRLDRCVGVIMVQRDLWLRR